MQLGDVVGCAQLAVVHASEPEQVQGRAAAVVTGPSAEEATEVDFDAGLLSHFASDTLDRILALHEKTADDVPQTAEGLVRAAREQHTAVIVLGQCARSDRRVRVEVEAARPALDDPVAARKLMTAPRTERPSVEHRHARTLPRATGATQHELSRIGLLATLSGETLGRLAENMRREEVPAGAPVLNEGDDGDRFYVVLSGMLAVSQASRGPQSVLRPGDYFGEVALAMNMPRTASVRALTPATVASCDRATFDEFVRPLFADDG